MVREVRKIWPPFPGSRSGDVWRQGYSVDWDCWGLANELHDGWFCASLLFTARFNGVAQDGCASPPARQAEVRKSHACWNAIISEEREMYRGLVATMGDERDGIGITSPYDDPWAAPRGVSPAVSESVASYARRLRW